jgi:aminoglycoside 2'-N-acetyltransferase I
MMKMELELAVKKNRDLSEKELEEIITLCSNAFNEDFRPYMKDFIGSRHILGYYEDVLVSHVLWLNRWIRIENTPLLKTAFLDAVAVDEKYRKRGYASSTMTRFTEEITDYDMAVLTTGSPDFYERLGWQAWLGSVSFQRVDGQITSLNNSTLMTLFHPRTPALDVNTPLTVEWHD